MASEARARLQPGTVVRDTYEVDTFIGAGAYGDVYRVHHRFLGEQALKLVEVGPDAPPFDELLNEARVLASLSHQNVVRLFDADLYATPLGETPFFTMEYLERGALAGLMARRIRFAVIEALEAGAQMTAGLGAAHSLAAPVLHRDVTPGNVLVASEQPLLLKLSDFGLAAHVNPETRLLRAAGTIKYQPPEAAWGYATEASDLYAVALIMFELLTGVAPFPVFRASELQTSLAVAEAIRGSRKEPPAPPSRYRRELSGPVDELVLAALEPRPEDRFRTATEFERAIRAVLDAEAAGVS